jgi:cyanophycinase
MFTGGDQLRLTSILGELFHDILLDKYHNEEFVCGNFRAAAASNSMIYQGSSSSLIKRGSQNH